MIMENYFHIKNIVKSQLPEFVREQHPLFTDFMIAYYEWMSQNEGTFLKSTFGDVTKKYLDIDETVSDFFEYFFKQYLENFPIYLVLDNVTGKKLNPKTVIKNIKKFYSAKGTEKSYRLIFRILYNSEIQLYYPKNDILRLSDSKWVEKKFVRIRKTNGSDEFELKGNYVYQKEDITNPFSKYVAKAKVVEVKEFTLDGIRIVDIEIDDIEGSFEKNKNIYCTLPSGETKKYAKISPLLSRINISSGGEYYSENDDILFSLSNQNIKFGVKPKAFISRTINLDSNLGAVKQIVVDDPGFNADIFQISGVESELPGASGFSGQTVFDSVFVEKGYYLENSQNLSSNKKIQDNNYYQDYSYVIRTDLVFSEYRDIITKILHPAGFKMFGETLIRKCLSTSSSVFLKILKKNVKRIGNYLPYTFLTFDNLASWFLVNGIPQGYTPEGHDPLVICGTANCVTGNPTSSSVDYVQFPTSQSLSADIEPGMYPNDTYGYWVTYDHPNRTTNRRIIDPVFVFIHPNQLEDFYGDTTAGDGQSSAGWQEWLYSTERVDVPSRQIQFFQDLYNSVDPILTPLVYSNESQFRKMSIESFINDLMCDYDCRVSDECISELSITNSKPKNEDKYISVLNKYSKVLSSSGLNTSETQPTSEAI